MSETPLGELERRGLGGGVPWFRQGSAFERAFDCCGSSSWGDQF